MSADPKIEERLESQLAIRVSRALLRSLDGLAEAKNSTRPVVVRGLLQFALDAVEQQQRRGRQLKQPKKN